MKFIFFWFLLMCKLRRITHKFNIKPFPMMNTQCISNIIFYRNDWNHNLYPAVHSRASFDTHLNCPVTVHVKQVSIPKNVGCDCRSSLINTVAA